MVTSGLRLAAAALLTATCLSAQVAWFSADGRYDHALAPNPLTGGLLVFGGTSDGTGVLGDTWVQDGFGAWIRADPALRPPAVRGAAMSALVLPGAVGIVMFGGVRTGTVRSGETWTWNGNSWTFEEPPAAPPARFGHGLAWDPGQQRTVLFGGDGATGLLNDVWEFDAARTWTQRNPTGTPPSPRTGHTVTYRPIGPGTGRVMVFGGTGNSNETWEYDGRQSAGRGSWVRVTTGANTPSGRRDHGAAYDVANGRVVLFGGRDASGARNDTWTYDPALPGWVQSTPAQSPPARFGHRMEYDASFGVQAVIMIGGRDDSGRLLHDTWRWTGSNWQQLAPPPEARTQAAMTYDSGRQQLLLFGGASDAAGTTVLGDTWTFDGQVWARRFANTPLLAPRRGAALAFDSSRARAILFGGEGASAQMLGDTWRWDGSNWLVTAPTVSPSARRGAAVAYDANRDRVILFGGLLGGGVPSAETWEWDVSTWRLRSPTPTPAARYDTALAYDPIRRRTYLFGGQAAGNVQLGDTWYWDGGSWSLVANSGPTGRSGHGLVYDLERGVLVLTGGHRFNTSLGAMQPLDDVWELSGSTWTQRSPLTVPPPRAHQATVYDAARRRVMGFGGQINTPNPVAVRELWEYGPEFPAAVAAAGGGCPGSNARVPTLRGASQGLPWLGATLQLELSELAPSAFGLFYLGASDTQWGALPLPAPLDPLMPGCVLRVSLDVALGGVASPGGVLSVPVPADPALLGQRAFSQAVVADLPVNTLGAVLSNAVSLRFGGR